MNSNFVSSDSKNCIKRSAILLGSAFLVGCLFIICQVVWHDVPLPSWFKQSVSLCMDKLSSSIFGLIWVSSCILGMSLVRWGLKRQKKSQVFVEKTHLIEEDTHRSNIELSLIYAQDCACRFKIVDQEGIQRIERVGKWTFLIRALFFLKHDFDTPLISALNASAIVLNSLPESKQESWKIKVAKYNRYLETSSIFRKGEKDLIPLNGEKRKAVSFVKKEKQNDLHLTHPIYKKGRWYYREDQANHILEATFIFVETQLKRMIRALSFKKIFQYQNKEEAEEDIYQFDEARLYSDSPIVHNIGHASLLFQLNGMNILTDPIFGDLNALLYPRKTRPGLNPEDLPPIDVILISHNHRDHCDVESLKIFLAHQPILLVAKGDLRFFHDLGFHHVYEHEWWEKTVLKRNEKEVHFFSLPSRHWSGRGVFDTQKSLTCSWAFKAAGAEEVIYFRGDTANIPEKTMAEIRHFVEGFIVANFEPGGPNHSRSWMQSTHQSVLDSLFTQFEVTENENRVVCTYLMHHNAYELGTDRFNEAIKIKNQILDYLKTYQKNSDSKETQLKWKKLPSFVRKELKEGKLEKILQIGIEKFISQSEKFFFSPKIGQRLPLLLGAFKK